MADSPSKSESETESKRGPVDPPAPAPSSGAPIASPALTPDAIRLMVAEDAERRRHAAGVEISAVLDRYRCVLVSRTSLVPIGADGTLGIRSVPVLEAR